jgi:hypothetical protein
MGKISEHQPVKYFTALTFVTSLDLQPVFSEIEALYSSIESKSRIYDFSSFTDYYQREMGDKLNKIFVVYSDLGPPERLPELKIKSINLEKKFAVKGSRQINLDPGYICQAKLVLATTKNYSHRLYLGHGIFGDLHLQFYHGSFQKQPWTYPDYLQVEMVQFFNEVRMGYMKQLGALNHN